MVTFFRKRPCVFDRFYGLRQRVEAGWHSLKSLVEDIVRSKTEKTTNAEIRSKINCYELIWTTRGNYGF